MSKYTQASDKSSKLLVNRITLRLGALKSILEFIKSRNEPLERGIIEDQFGLPSESEENDQISDSLAFLHQIDMIEKSNDSTITPINTKVHSEMDFEPRLLYHLSQQEGRQHHYRDIHGVLINQDKTPIDLDDFVVEVRRNTEYEFTWNDKKIRGWGEVMDDIGVLRFTENEFYSVPCRALVFDVLSKAEDETSGSARRMLQYIHENFFPCLLAGTDQPVVYGGLSSAIRNMETEGVLKQISEADALEVVEVTPENAQDHGVISRIEIIPDKKPSDYHYPVYQLRA